MINKIILKIVLTLSMVMFVSIYSQAQTWYVSTTGSNANTGTNISNAFATVSHAINLSSCGDSIYVLSGIYNEKILATKICPENNRLVIQGDITNRPLVIGDAASTNKYAILATGEGFRFRHFELTSPFPLICNQSNQVIVGDGDHYDFIDIIVRNSGYDGIKTYGNCVTGNFPVDWKIINCQIFNNGLSCPTNGDGIDFTRCQDCLIKGSTIKNNAGYQIQIKLEAKNVTVEDCHIQGKDLFLIGLPGATPQCDSLALNADSVFIRHNTLLSINDEYEFMIKLADVSNVYIENNTFIKDSINNNNVGFICFGGCRGGSMWLNHPTGPMTIENNIFYNFSATPLFYGPDTIALYDPFTIMGTTTIGYNLFFDNNGQFTVPVDGSINSLVANPLLCNYPNSFELKSTSPCIDAGNPLSPTDPDSSVTDIGARYYNTPCTVGLTNQLISNEILISPNPSTGRFKLEIESNYSELTVSIFSILGERVLSINNQTEIDISNLTSGTYFLKITIDGKIGTSKIIKIE